MTTFWSQIDFELRNKYYRLYMDDCGGRDQVVRAISQSNWSQYEPPLPTLIARYCQRWQPIFIDIGANTGYYSLLAASVGASHVWAFEPVPEIRDIFKSNVNESALLKKITIISDALGDNIGEFDLFLPNNSHGLIETSASLNRNFRDNHSGIFKVAVSTLDQYFKELIDFDNPQKILMKIDVESLEPQVLKGGELFIKKLQPCIVVEILPGSDVAYFQDFAKNNNYTHFWLNSDNNIAPSGNIIQTSFEHRDHLFIPEWRFDELKEALS